MQGQRGLGQDGSQKNTLLDRMLLLRRRENMLPYSADIGINFAIILPELESWRS